MLTKFQEAAIGVVCDVHGIDAGIEALVLFENTGLGLGRSILKACGVELENPEPPKDEGKRFCPYFASLL